MPLHLHTSNRLEALADALFADWRRDSLDPLATRALVVESAPLGRWVKGRLCRDRGVAMLVDTPLPAAWLWQAALSQLGMPAGEDPLSRERMHWRVHHLLGSEPALREAGDGGLAAYLAEDDELRRWQLAGRIADVFDRYQYHRPELIRAWNAGDFSDGGWQGPLWARLSEDAPWQRVSLLDRFMRRLQAEEAPDGLPGRVDLFSLHALPRLLLEAWVALSRHCAVHLWVLSPTDQYWADLATPRQLARQRLEDPESAELWQLGHPLLTRWGRQGQVFQDMLLQATAELSIDDERHQPPAGATLLHRLQAEIFEATAPEAQTVADEDERLPSIQLHVCHSAMRECQVLRDTLLHCLAADPTLQPEDILVMAPEISRYAPYLEAVFGRGDDQAPALPYNLSDVSQADEHPLIQAFLALLDLPGARFTRAEVVALLHLPEIQHRHGLNEEDVAALVELLDELHTYWGLDAEDKQRRLDLPAIPDNTWQQAFERVMAGLALGEDGLYQDIAPLAHAGVRQAERAARLFDLLDRLRRAASELARPSDAAGWARRLAGLVRELFGEIGDEEGRLERIHEALSELAGAAELHPGELGLPVIRHWLAASLGSSGRRDRPYSGGITCCALQPLRGVPFRVIALLGMQEKAFPRRQAAPDFDQMATAWRHGDPQPGQEDRYLFLETLLAARERLILSWTGRDPRSNEPLQASVVIDELVEHLTRHYRLKDGGDLLQRIRREHPLQPFSARNYRAVLPSFDPWWANAAALIEQHRPPPRRPGWPDLELPLPDDFERRVAPDALGRFLREPARRFVQRRLRLGFDDEAPLAECEPFQRDGLWDWQIGQRILAAWLGGEDEQALMRRLRAEGLLLHGEAGERQFQSLLEDLAPVREAARPLRSAPCDCDLTIELGDGREWRLEGRLAHHYKGPQLLSFSASRLYLADLLPLWVEYLCLHVSGEGAPIVARHLHREGVCRLKPVGPDEARQWLRQLLAIYEQGLTRPLPLFRKSSSVWAAQADEPKKAWPAALREWEGDWRRGGEADDGLYRVLLTGHDWEPDEDFAELAEAVLVPLAEHLELS